MTSTCVAQGSGTLSLPADHLKVIGYRGDGPSPNTVFDYARFYRNLAFEVAEVGD